jgi:hypothetical protein
MRRSPTTRNITAAALALTAASAAHASVSYFDGVFNPSNWNEITITNAGGAGSSTNASQSLVGGNPNEFRRIDMSLVAGTPGAAVFSLNINNLASYDPTTQGAVTSIDYSEDSINLLAGSGDGQATGLLIVQNGIIYIQRTPVLVMPYSTFSTWAQNAAPGLVASDMWEIMGNGFVDPNSNPDFTATASVMQLGFWRGASSGNFTGQAFREAGIDNWSVRVVPTPASLGLLAPAGLLAFSRRRR